MNGSNAYTRARLSEEYIARDAANISPSYTRSYPFVMAQGRGSEVWDVDGRRYIDFTSGIAVTNTGHAHPEVVRAIVEQAERFIHMSGTDFYYPVQIELAEKLNEVAPITGATKVFFGNSGAEAVEAAMKLARYHTGRPRFVAFQGGFHGRTFGALSLTASKPVQRRGFAPLLPEVTHAIYPNPYRNPWPGRDPAQAALEYIEHLFRTTTPPEEVAAIIVEPIQGEGGYIVPPDGFLPGLRELCDRYGILLVLDEVQTGMGRTGKMFACEHWSVEPDILCVAKGIASGLPLGAIVARSEIMNWPPGAHASTFGGNPVSCAAALVTIRLLEDGLIEQARRHGEKLMARLQEIASRFPQVGDVRGKGLMVGVELVEDRESKRPAVRLRDEVIQEAFHKGLLMLGCGQSGLRFVPALNIPEALLDEGVNVFERALAEALEKVGGAL
ncbi:MAG: acetyl ornithine aminotransferase family protein [Caldilineae bacterium]|nr:MAG: acetyl ornithine aminotransferase family protein [Caldilineae bacterium]